MIIEKLKNKLSEIPFNTYFALSVLEGHVEGQVIVDDENSPTAAYIQHKYGMALLCGDCKNKEFNNKLKQFLSNRQEGTWVQVYPAAWDDFMQKVSKQVMIRLNFEFNQELFEKSNKKLDSQNTRRATMDEAKKLYRTCCAEQFLEGKPFAYVH